MDKEGIFMFEKIKEKQRLKQEERERQIAEERNRLLSLSEKELLVEILLELQCVENRIDHVARTVALHGN